MLKTATDRSVACRILTHKKFSPWLFGSTENASHVTTAQHSQSCSGGNSEKENNGNKMQGWKMREKETAAQAVSCLVRDEGLHAMTPDDELFSELQ